MSTRAQVIESTIECAVPENERPFVLGVLRNGNVDKAERITRNWIGKNPLGLQADVLNGLLLALDSVGAIAP